MKTKWTAIVLATVLVGCSNPGIVQTGPNAYLIARNSAAGAFANTAKLKAEVIREANDYAAKQGKVAEGISLKEVRPIVGGFPSCEYQFKLVGAGSSSENKPIQTKNIYLETGE